MAMSRPLRPRWPANRAARWTWPGTGAPCRRIVLYEPPGPQATRDNWPERVAAMVAAGQAGRGAFTFLTEIVGLTRSEVEALRDAPSPPWAGEITRELATALPAATGTELPGRGHRLATNNDQSVSCSAASYLSLKRSRFGRGVINLRSESLSEAGRLGDAKIATFAYLQCRRLRCLAALPLLPLSRRLG
jgi:hypothetical protein